MYWSVSRLVCSWILLVWAICMTAFVISEETGIHLEILYDYIQNFQVVQTLELCNCCKPLMFDQNYVIVVNCSHLIRIILLNKLLHTLFCPFNAFSGLGNSFIVIILAFGWHVISIISQLFTINVIPIVSYLSNSLRNCILPLWLPTIIEQLLC